MSRQVVKFAATMKSKRELPVNLSSGFDPITLNHWLWYKYRCHESTFTEFERLFQEIIKRARKQFMQIKPYGNIGDRKCDGLLLGDEVTIFQVYAPDELKLAELKSKIDEDLDFAAEHWRDYLQAWTFVYNVRRGVAPDVATEILRKQQQYQHLAIGHMSNDQLWEIARNELSLQQRAEVLGGPAGYEYMFLSPGATTSEVRELLDKSWSVIIQDTMSPVNLGAILPALEPDVPFGAPFYIRPSLSELGWREAAEYQLAKVQELLERTGDILPRYAVFSFAHIPLAIHLGFLLSDRLEVRYFQYDRYQKTWKWPYEDEATIDLDFHVTGLPTAATLDGGDVVVRVSLSAQIWHHQTTPIVPDAKVVVDIAVGDADVKWLQNPQQVVQLGAVFENVLKQIRNKMPNCKRIHMFYAGPTPGAIVIGQHINPRMNAPIALYQYSMQTDPQYQFAFELSENLGISEW